MVEVTEADRLAAAELIEAYWQGFGQQHDLMRKLAQRYRAGHAQGVWTYAFARHREAHMEKAAQIAENYASYDDALQKSAGCMTAGQRIAASIRAALTNTGGSDA